MNIIFWSHSVVLTQHPWTRLACWWLCPRWWGPSAGFQGLQQSGCAGDAKDDLLTTMWPRDISHGLADHTLFCCLSGYKFVYLSGVRHVVVVMVDDCRLLLIDLNAALTAQLPQRVTCANKGNRVDARQRCEIPDCVSEKPAGKDRLTNVRTGSNQDISSTIDEGSNCLHVDVSSKVCTRANKNIWKFVFKNSC